MNVTFSTDVNAPGCIGEIRSDDGGSVLIQTDWDWPGVASTFGWDIRSVQVAQRGYYGLAPCEHSGTDGTIDCPDCGLKASTFIRHAGDWLRSDGDGSTAEDPGYFSD